MGDQSSQNKSSFLSNRFESLVENGADCVLIISAEAKTTYVSRSITNILGYTPNEVMEMDIMKRIHPDDVAGSQEAILTAIQNPGIPIQGHLSRVLHKNGSWIWVDAVITNMLHDPAINGIVDNFRDVTDRVLAEEKANETTQCLLLATKGARIGIWEQDLRNNRLVWDEVMHELYGVEKDQFDGEYASWLNLIHEDDIPKINEVTNELRSGKTEFFVEFRILRPDGSMLHIRSIAHAQKDADGNAIRLIGTNWDVTESRKSNAKFRNLLENAPDAMVIVNENNCIELVNSETEKMFGFSKSELIGQPVTMLLSNESSDNPFVLDREGGNQMSIGEIGEGIDFFAVNKNGEHFPVEINVAALNTGDGLLLSAAIRDVTVRKKTEAKLLRMAAVEAKNEEMEQLAYITSHDLREPLLTMKQYSQVLQKMFNDSLGEQGTHLLNTIIRSADRMEERINDLLNYSQLGQVKELTVLDCNDTLQLVTGDLNLLIEKNEAKITTENLPTAMKAYGTELQLIFQNLINNAIKFKATDRQPKVHISSEIKNDGWEFKVADNGIGIAEKHFKKVFSIFQKLHSSTDYPGSGIGLAQVKKLVEMHNGQIEVESKIGEGTTFIFSINTENR